jgi:type IV pilus assembly protein PilV
MKITNKTIQQTNTGFGLIEILVSILILAIGLLGLAGLQATSINQNHSAYSRSQATQLAYDLADRIRSNSTASGNYITADTSTAVATTCTAASSCTPAEMAESDLYEWNLMLTSTLPLAEADVSQISGTYTITINWDDNRDSLVDGNDPDFQVSFKL